MQVRNQGQRGTEDVVQLYIKDEKSPDAPANPILCGFQRVRLEAGEQKTLEIPIDPRAFTVVNEQGERVPGSGSWTLHAHTGQPDARTYQLTGRSAVSKAI